MGRPGGTDMASTAGALLGRPAPVVSPYVHWQDRLAQGLLLVCCMALCVFLLAPLATILIKSVQDKSGAFVGLLQFQDWVLS